MPKDKLPFLSNELNLIPLKSLILGDEIDINSTAGKYIQTNGEPTLGSKDNFNLFDRQEDEELQSVEGKREYYKIRLSSKKTGRQCDVNVYFKTKHNPTKEEEKSKNNAP